MLPLLDVASSYGDAVTTIFSAPILAKVWLATFAFVLVIVQLSTAARMWGKLRGIVPLSDSTAKQVHRWSGRLAIIFTLPVVFHCVTILGFQTTSLRVAVHSVALRALLTDAPSVLSPAERQLLSDWLDRLATPRNQA